MYVEGGMTVKARQILVTAVDRGSPADGVLEPGDVVLGTFGRPFDEDARKALGKAIGRAETEACRGVLPLIVWRKGRTRSVNVKLQVMGSYSDTSPYDCPKARRILERGCALIARNIRDQNRFPINELALMASGDSASCGLRAAVRGSSVLLMGPVPSSMSPTRCQEKAPGNVSYTVHEAACMAYSTRE